MAARRAIQIYETSLLSSEHCFHAVVVPRHSFPRKRRFKRVDILDHLNLEPVPGVTIDASNLLTHLAILLSRQSQPRELPDRLDALRQMNLTVKAHTPFRTFAEDERFAQRAAFERIIPVVESELSRESLATLVLSAGRRKNRNYVEIVTHSNGMYPVLLLSVPAGIILCGDAIAMGYTLEDAGLRDQLFSLLKGGEPTT